MHPTARLYNLASHLTTMSKPIAIIAGVGPGVRPVPFAQDLRPPKIDNFAARPEPP